MELAARPERLLMERASERAGGRGREGERAQSRRRRRRGQGAEAARRPLKVCLRLSASVCAVCLRRLRLSAARWPLTGRRQAASPPRPRQADATDDWQTALCHIIALAAPARPSHSLQPSGLHRRFARVVMGDSRRVRRVGPRPPAAERREYGAGLAALRCPQSLWGTFTREVNQCHTAGSTRLPFASRR